MTITSAMMAPPGALRRRAMTAAVLLASFMGLQACGSDSPAQVQTPTRPVATVNITAPAGDMVVGETRTLVATTRDVSGAPLTGRAVTWSSSVASVAVVGTDGTLTAVAAGETEIRAMSEGKIGTVPVRVIALAPTPIITTISPASVQSGTNDFELRVEGQHFTSASTIHFDNVALTTVFVDANTLRATVPSAAATTARTVNVSVRTPAPGGGAAAPLALRIEAPAQPPIATVVIESPLGSTWSWAGESFPVRAVATDAQGRENTAAPVTWSTLDAQLAMVTVTGSRTARVSGIAPGVTRVRAQFDGIRLDRDVHVYAAPNFDLVYGVGSGANRGLAIWQPGLGTTPVNVPLTQIAFEPSPSPDGQRIAFTGMPAGSGDAGNQDIYVTSRDGSDVRRLTDDPAPDYEAAFSPDGARIAFTSKRRDGLPDVWVMNADGSAPLRLTEARRQFELPGSGYGAFAPAWSPDGTKIVYSVYVPFGAVYRSALWVMNADGSGKHQLTTGAEASDFTPTWSPDGRHITFNRLWVATNRMQLYSVDAASGQAVFPYYNDGFVVAGTPAYSPDGKWITVTDLLALENNPLWVVTGLIDTGPRMVLPPELRGAKHARWTRRL